jgi:uncharacterized protein YndB with AHSA1/START domain
MTKQDPTAKLSEVTGRQHETSIQIDAPIEEVWKAITDAAAMARWFAPKMTVEPGVGGFVLADWGPGLEWKTTIELWEPNRRLRLVETRDQYISASPVAETFEPCRLIQDYYLESAGGKTVLRLVHSGFGSGENWDIEYEGTRGGWAGCFLRMKLGLEQHRDESVRHMFMTWTCNGRAYADVLKQIESGSASALDVGLRGAYHFCAVVPDLNGSVLNVSVQPCPVGSMAYIEAILFGTAGQQAEAFEAEWKARLSSLFPPLAASHG